MALPVDSFLDEVQSPDKAGFKDGRKERARLLGNFKLFEDVVFMYAMGVHGMCWKKP